MNSVKAFQRTAIFISGHGSCLQALLEMSEFQNISVVITNKRNALGVLKAKRFGVEVIYINSTNSFTDINEILRKKRIQKIFLAGFMKILPDTFLQEWKNHIFNIHPSLLPAFKGLNAFENSYLSGSDLGVTLHHVVEDMDSGEIVLQKKIVFSNSENPQVLPKDLALRYLQASEQHILREYSQKGSSLCLRF